MFDQVKLFLKCHQFRLYQNHTSQSHSWEGQDTTNTNHHVSPSSLHLLPPLPLWDLPLPSTLPHWPQFWAVFSKIWIQWVERARTKICADRTTTITTNTTKVTERFFSGSHHRLRQSSQLLFRIGEERPGGPTITSEDHVNHAEALRRHAAHKSQLAEVVELHKALVDNKHQVEQKLPSTTTVSATTEPTFTPSPEINQDKDQTTLSDIQQDVIDNLELIAALVKQVLVLDDRATKIFYKTQAGEKDCSRRGQPVQWECNLE